MTTETLERAAGVIEKLERDGYRFLDDLSGYNESTLISYIAAAITQAEDAKLGEVLALLQADFDDAGGDAQNAIHDCMAVIRNLKTKEN